MPELTTAWPHIRHGRPWVDQQVKHLKRLTPSGQGAYLLGLFCESGCWQLAQADVWETEDLAGINI